MDSESNGCWFGGLYIFGAFREMFEWLGTEHYLARPLPQMEEIPKEPV